jgi:tetratricopeptide (TPR) repeat protein
MRALLRFFGLIDASGADGTGATTTIGPGIKLKGELQGEGTLVMLGHFEGDISLDGVVHVGPDARLDANVSARAVVIAGVMRGNLSAAVLIAAAAAGWLWSATQQRRADAAYAEAMLRVAAASAPDATSEAKSAAARALEDLVARYPSGTQGAKAALDLANLRYDNRDYAAARAAYEIAARRGSSPTITTFARSGIGHAWETERDFAKAADAYQALARDLRPRDFLYENTLLDLARAQEEAGQRSDAAATYQRLLKDVPGSRHADDVRRRLAGLGSAAR